MNNTIFNVKSAKMVGKVEFYFVTLSPLKITGNSPEDDAFKIAPIKSFLKNKIPGFYPNRLKPALFSISLYS